MLMYEKRGGLITEKGMAYPLARWTNKDVMQYIKSRNLIRPFVYVEGNVSQGFGIELPTLLLMQYRYPGDFEKMLEMFPYSAKLLYDFTEGYIPLGFEEETAKVLKSVGKEYLMPKEIKTVAAVAPPPVDDTPEE